MSFNLCSIPANQPSLCIPRVFHNIDEQTVRLVFNKLALGTISHVDFVVKKSDKGNTFKRVYIHFHEWFWNTNAVAARQTLLEGKEIKVVYDAPWFWKVSANRSPSPAPFIDFGSSALAPVLAPVLAPALAPVLNAKPQPTQKKNSKPQLNPKAQPFKPKPSVVVPEREPRDEDLEPDVEYCVLPVPPKPPMRRLLKKDKEPTTQMVVAQDSLYEDL
jgi:hypothetical protein